MPNITARPPGHPGPLPLPRRAPIRSGPVPVDRSDPSTLRIVSWLDPIADPHGVPPCSRYVELYWLPIIGPSA